MAGRSAAGGVRRRSMATSDAARRASTMRRDSLAGLMALESRIDKAEDSMAGSAHMAAALGSGGLEDAQIRAGDDRAAARQRQRMTPRLISVNVSWTVDKAFTKEDIKALLTPFGRVKHIKVSSLSKGRAVVTFRTEQSVGKALIAPMPNGVTVAPGKTAGNNKLLVAWAEKDAYDENSLWSIFEDYGKLRYITVDNTGEAATRHKRAIVSYQSAAMCEAVLNDRELREEEFHVSEYLPPPDVDTVSKAELVLSQHKGHVVPQEELTALYDLFRATGGADWTFKYGWERYDGVPCVNTDPTKWYGVTVEGGRVVRLELAGNNLVGRLPESIGAFKALRALWVQHNEIEGAVPFEIGQLTELHSLYLQRNKLKRLPPSIDRLTKLQLLGLLENNWDVGGLPDCLEFMDSLKIDR